MAHRANWQATGQSRCARLSIGHTCREQRPHTVHWCQVCGAKAVDENGDPLPEDRPLHCGAEPGPHSHCPHLDCPDCPGRCLVEEIGVGP